MSEVRHTRAAHLWKLPDTMIPDMLRQPSQHHHRLMLCSLLTLSLLMLGAYFTYCADYRCFSCLSLRLKIPHQIIFVLEPLQTSIWGGVDFAAASEYAPVLDRWLTTCIDLRPCLKCVFAFAMLQYSSSSPCGCFLQMVSKHSKDDFLEFPA